MSLFKLPYSHYIFEVDRTS